MNEKNLMQKSDQCNMNLIYGLAIKTCNKIGNFHLMKRWEAAYKLYKLRKLEKYPRLNGQGEFGGMFFIGTNPSIRSKLNNLWEDPYGIYFGDFLKEAGINKNEIYITNLYKYPTENNRPLEKEEIKRGREELALEIIMVNPTVIVPMGKQAEDEFKNFKDKMFEIYPIYHPSYVNRFPENKGRFIEDLKKIKKINDKKRMGKRSSFSRKNR